MSSGWRRPPVGNREKFNKRGRDKPRMFNSTLEETVEEAHLSTLTAKHAQLEHEIAEESHRPLPDTLHLTELKRIKLRVKEEIARLSKESS